MFDLSPNKINNKYKSQSKDTSIEADLFMFKRFHQMSFKQKLALIKGLNYGSRKLCLLGIKNKYSQITNQEIYYFYAQKILGDKSIFLSNQFNIKNTIMIGDPLSLAIIITDKLDQLNIPYFIGGSVASSLWGEPRSTLDLDIVADFSIDKIPDFLELIKLEFYVNEDAIKQAIFNQSSFNLIHFETVEKIDIFIPLLTSLSKQEMNRRRLQEIEEYGKSIYFCSPEDIILQKLIWYRLGNEISERQWRDVLGVLKTQSQDLDLKYLWDNALSENISNLLQKALEEAGLFS